jgi:F420H(2)-dependent quinone reductase
MWFNPLMEWLLKSPLHGMLSGNTMIIYYNGQKSGKDYHVPIGYLQVDNTLLTVSLKQRTWWRNLRCNAPVKILVKRKMLPAHACAFEDDASIADGLKTFIKENPRMASALKVDVGADGEPANDSLQRAVSEHVIVRTTPD